ncbi:acyl carrier protein [Anaeroselena agilis]|uniref:Acyl carrier protein n=1 Tax=Anaeroselena agilis TaxID=3063788 RepID=A0ABU3NSE8_9FIRM|nr:acyl carrier protein [Selenomonadales bacterium 4137-cl]
MADADELKKILAGVFKVPVASIGEQTLMQDIDTWDSLTHMDLILTLENEYGVTFSGEEIVVMTSFAKIAATLAAKGV